MATKNSVSMEVGIDLELLLKSIADKKLMDPVRKHLSQMTEELSKAGKIPLDMHLDTKGLEKEFHKAIKQLAKDFAKPLKELGANLGEGNIAKELSKRLREAGDTVTKDGKIVKEKLHEILAQISNEAGLKGAISSRGKNPLKGYLDLADKSMTDALKSLREKSKDYNNQIRAITKAQRNELKAAETEFRQGYANITKLESKGKAATQRDIDKSRSIYERSSLSAQAGTTRYEDVRRTGSGASKEDHISTAKEYKNQLMNARNALEGLKTSGMITDLLPSEIERGIKALDTRIKELNIELRQLTGSYKQAEEGASHLQKRESQLTESIEAQRMAASNARAVYQKTQSTDDLEKRIRAVKSLRDTYVALSSVTGNDSDIKRAERYSTLLDGLQKRLEQIKNTGQDSKALSRQLQSATDASDLAARKRGLSRQDVDTRLKEARAEESTLRKEAALYAQKGQDNALTREYLELLQKEITALEAVKKAKSEDERLTRSQEVALLGLEKTLAKKNMLLQAETEGTQNQLAALKQTQAAMKALFAERALQQKRPISAGEQDAIKMGNEQIAVLEQKLAAEKRLQAEITRVNQKVKEAIAAEQDAATALKATTVGTQARIEAIHAEQVALGRLISTLSQQRRIDPSFQTEDASKVIENLRQQATALGNVRRTQEAIVALQEKINQLQKSETELKLAKKHLDDKGYLRELDKQINATFNVMKAMADLKLDPARLKPYSDAMERLKTEADALRIKISQDRQKSGRPSDLTAAREKEITTLNNLIRAEERYASFGPSAGAREKMQMFIQQRSALESYIVALQHLSAAEKDAFKQGIIATELSKRRQQLAELENQIGGVNNAMAQMVRAFQAFLRYAVAYQVLYQIQGGFRAIVSEVVNLQDALVGIKAVSVATTSQMADIEASIKAVAETTSFTTDEIAKGGQTLVQAGVATEDFGKALRATANLASATGSTFAKGAEVMTTFMNVFDKIDPDTIADKLTNAVNISKLNIQDLTSIANYLLSTTESFNISLDNTLAAATTLRNAGFKASTIATGTRQAILELLSPDAKTLKALSRRYSELGMTMSEQMVASMFAGFRGSKNPLVSALNELEKLGFGSTGDKQLSRVFDIRAENVIRALIQNKDELIANETALQRAGSAAQGAKTQLESLKNSFQNLQETVVTLFYDESKGMVAGLKKASDYLTEMVGKLREYTTEYKASTGESSVFNAAATGAIGAGARLAQGASIARAGGAGVGIAALELYTSLLGETNVALKAFAKAIEIASEAALAKAVIDKLGGISGIKSKAGNLLENGLLGMSGKKAAMDMSKLSAAGARTTPMDMSKLSAYGARAEAPAVAVAPAMDMSKLAPFGARSVAQSSSLLTIVGTQFTRLAGALGGFLAANPIIAVVLALEALTEFHDWATVSYEKAKSKSDALSIKTQKLKEDLIKSQEQEAADSASALQLQKTSEKLNTATAGIKELGGGQDVMALSEKAAQTVVAIGSQAFEDYIKELEGELNRDLSTTEKFDIATKLQDLNAVTQEVEASRKQYIEKITKAYSDASEDPDNIQANETIKAFEALPKEKQLLLQSSLKSVEDAQSLIEAIRATLKTTDHVQEIAAIAEAKAKELEPYFETAKGTLYQGFQSLMTFGGLTDLTGTVDQYRKDQKAATYKIMSELTTAVESGDVALTRMLVERIKATFSSDKIPEMVSEAVSTSIENAVKEASKVFKEAKHKVEVSQKEADKPTSSLSEADTYTQALKGKEVAAAQAQLEKRKKLEEELAAKQAEVVALSDEGEALNAAKGDPNKINALKKETEAKATEVENIQNQLSKLKEEELDAALKLKEIKQSFTAGEAHLADLQAQLKTLTEQKVKDFEGEAVLTQEIYDAKVAQLAAEKKTLGEMLGKQAKEAGLGDASGLSPEQILAALSGSAGSEAMKSNEQLANTYKELAEVIRNEGLLRQQLDNDLEKVAKAEIEERLKQVKRAYEPEEQKVKDLEKELASATGAKLKDSKKTVGIIEEIYQIKTKQLESEKEILAEILARAAAEAGLQVKDKSAQGLMDLLATDKGRSALAKNEELGKAYEELAKVVYEESNLRDKLTTDLDNVFRKELETKQKKVKSESEKADKKVSSVENKLQSVTDKLTAAREKLANQYEKMGELEAYFGKMLRDVKGKPVKAKDIRNDITQAADSGSIELAKEAASTAQGMIGKGLSKSEAERLIRQAADVAYGIQQADINTADQHVQDLEQQQAALTEELKLATESQIQLKDELQRLNNAIAGIAGQVAEQVDGATVAAEANTNVGVKIKQENDIAPGMGFAQGGPISGPGSTTSDSIPILASQGEFMQPANAVSLYGEGFMEKLRNLQIDPAILKAVAASPKSLGGTTAQKQKQMQPVMFNIDGAMIGAQAQPDAVKQFQAALRLQAVKNGRRA